MEQATPITLRGPDHCPARRGLSLILALAGGAITWGVVEGIHPVFSVPKEYEAPDIGMPPEVYRKNRWARERMERHHAMLYVGTLGAALAAGLALASRAKGRSFYGGAAAAIALATAGGVAGGHVASRVHEYIYEHYGQPALQHTVIEQMVLLLPLGLAVGLGWGLARLRIRQAIAGALAGLLAGLAAALAYPVAVSLLLPGASTDMLLPMERPSRALWFFLVSGTLGLVVPLAQPNRAHPDTLPSAPASAGDPAESSQNP